MLSNIKELFNDLDLFSKKVAGVNLSTIIFEQYNFSKGYMAIDTIFTKSDQFLSINEAFSAIFCKDLHDMHEWDITKQPSSDDLQWLKALKEIWIPENYLKFEGIQLEFVNIDYFINRVESDLDSLNVSKKEVSNLLKKITDNPEVLRLKKGHVYDKFFCQNNDYYFIYEWGIYA
ncbi:hypothetical protein ACFQ88_24500 [Paenibacillus sp. NPDC056579]|uniref:hypothetical protein n=1 Tax=Paenibacillus sp. NPDC056579 TaxID=3345871 RepID=UPI0036C2F05E